jgi:hypothetical protein
VPEQWPEEKRVVVARGWWSNARRRVVASGGRQSHALAAARGERPDEVRAVVARGRTCGGGWRRSGRPEEASAVVVHS